MGAAKKIKDLFCGAQETRTGTLVSVAVGALSKPVGYLRTLLLAWLFGASAGMDAVYTAMGILLLVCQIVQSVAESALLPRLIRQPEGKASALMACVSRRTFFCAAVLAITVCLFPASAVRFFARKFDAERLNLSAKMLVLFLPWALSLIVQVLMGVWNNHRGRYSLSISLGAVGYALMIPMIWASSGILGVFSVAAVYSLASSVLAAIIWRVTGDFPLKGAAEAGQLRGFASDCLLCVGIVGAVSLNQLVDRYFASGMAAGNISAISYAGLIYTLPQSILSPAMMIYLNRASRAAGNSETSRSLLEPVLSMSWLYVFPLSLFLACLASPVVTVFLGYGAFDAAAVALTAPCMTAAAWALPFMLWSQIFSRYAQACGQLKKILAVSYGALAANVALDWALAPRWGAPGLCAATGVALSVSALTYARLLARGSLGRVACAVWRPSVIFALCMAATVGLCGRGLAALMVGAAVTALYYLAGERLGFFAAVPPAWRPLNLLKLLPEKIGALR